MPAKNRPVPPRETDPGVQPPARRSPLANAPPIVQFEPQWVWLVPG